MSDDILQLLCDAEVECDLISPSTTITSSSDDSGFSRSISSDSGHRVSLNFAGRESVLHLREQHIEDVLEYLQKSVQQRPMASGRPPDGSRLAELLSQKERDLELAAKIGQSLLEQNKELQSRNEFLEENLASSTDTVVQLKHELTRRIELLRVYSHYDDDNQQEGSDDSSLQHRMDRLNKENSQLRQETSSLRKLTESLSEKERIQVKELARQLDAANEKIHSLQHSMGVKSEECQAQTLAVEGLLAEIAMKQGRERELMEENDELSVNLDDAVQRQQNLQQEMNGLQNEYAELQGMFCEAEEELVRYRQAPPRSQSVDSLYDSLASELENSDSGFSSTALPTSSRGHPLSLQLNQVNSTSEVDVPSSILADLVKRRICIEPLSTEAPPQTPQSETAATPLALGSAHLPEGGVFPGPSASPPSTSRSCLADDVISTPVKTAVLMRSMTCDASTSMDGEQLLATPSAIGAPLAESTPISSPRFEKGGLLQFSAPHSTSSSPHPSPRRLLGLSALSRPNTLSSEVTSSDDSLEDYVAPKMGEPGMPGTRDLDFSLKMLKARRQVEKDFAQFRRRRGLPPSTFFPNEASAVKRISSVDQSWTDYSVSCAASQHRASLSIGISAIKGSIGQGVLTRAELLSPQSSPLRSSSPSFPSGLAAIVPSFDKGLMGGTNGILRRFL